jgi:hypothetical protein
MPGRSLWRGDLFFYGISELFYLLLEVPLVYEPQDVLCPVGKDDS